MHKSKLFTLKDFFPFILTQLSENMCLKLAEVYTQRYGLIMPEWRVLANLAEHEILSASNIVGITSMEKSKVSRAVKSLSGKGLVLQQQTVEDARSKNLQLTAKGKALHQKIIPEMKEWEKEFLSVLSEKENEDLLIMLNKLSSKLTKREG